jgi:transposase-like protein
MTVSYEAIRFWCNKFGSKYARRLRRKHQGYGDTFIIDEVFVMIQGTQHYLWRTVDQDGEVVDLFLHKRREGKVAKRFFKRKSAKLNRKSGTDHVFMSGWVSLAVRVVFFDLEQPRSPSETGCCLIRSFRLLLRE